MGEQGQEQHIILTALYQKGSDSQLIHFDAEGAPEKGAANALMYGVQQGYDRVGVAPPFYMTVGDPMPFWEIKNGQFEACHGFPDLEWSDDKVKQFCDEITASGAKASKPQDIYEHLYDKWVLPEQGARPKPYAMCTAGMTHRDFYLLQRDETPKQVEALVAAGRMDADMLKAWMHSGANNSNITGGMIFTGEMLHTMPEAYQPRSLKISHYEFAHHGAQAVINGELVHSDWHFDYKGERKFGSPSDAELAGKLLDDYLTDKIKRAYDDLQQGYTLGVDKRGRERVMASMEIDGQMRQVSFNRTYGQYTLQDDDIRQLIKGEEITVPVRSGPARVKLGEGTYMGHSYFGLQRTDMPQRRVPDVEEKGKQPTIEESLTQ